MKFITTQREVDHPTTLVRPAHGSVIAQDPQETQESSSPVVAGGRRPLPAYKPPVPKWARQRGKRSGRPR